MNLMVALHLVSIFLEALTAGLGVLIARKKGKSYGWFIAATFTIWACYDLIKILPALRVRDYLTPGPEVLYPLFFAASLSICYAVWRIYREG